MLIGLITILSMLVMYAMLGSYFERNHPPLGHETGFIIILGIGVSFLIVSQFSA